MTGLWTWDFITAFMDQLDASGRGAAMLNTMGSIPSGAAGNRMHFAYALNDPFDFVSNPVEIGIIP